MLQTMLEYFLGNGKWLLDAILGMTGLVLLNVLVHWGVRGLCYRRGWVPQRWRIILDHSFWRPFHVALTIVGAQMLLRILCRELQIPIPEFLLRMIWGSVLLCIVWFCLGMVSAWRQRVFDHRAASREDRATVDLLAKVMMIATWVVVGFLLLDLLGLPLSGLLTLGTLTGGALAFAAKDVVANFFGGVMLYVTRPFVVGDAILIEKAGIEGYVEEIGWMLTQIRSKNKQLLFVPNSSFSSALVANVTRQSHRPLYETILLADVERTKIPQVLEAVQHLLNHFAGLDRTQKSTVQYVAIGPSGHALEIMAYTRELDEMRYLALRTHLLLTVTETLERLHVPLVQATLAVQT